MTSSVTFFLDNTHPPRFAVVLRALGYDVHHLQEKFEHASTSDVQWMPIVAKNAWICITGDLRIVKKPQERVVRAEAKLTTVFMPSGFTMLKLWPQFELLIKAWPNIVGAVERSRPGDCFEVQRNGKVSLAPDLGKP